MNNTELRITNGIAEIFAYEISTLLSSTGQPVLHRYEQIMQLVKYGLSVMEGFNDMLAADDSDSTESDDTIAEMLDELTKLLNSIQPPIQ